LINFGDLIDQANSAANVSQPPPDNTFYSEYLNRLMNNPTQVSTVKNGQVSIVSSKLSVATVATGRPQHMANPPQTPTLKRSACEISSPEDVSTMDESGSGTSPVRAALTAEQKKARNQAKALKRKEEKALEKAASPNNNNTGSHSNNKNNNTRKSKIKYF
jgi:hypothetical protein